MRTIILTYPGFPSLPRGIKQMLLATEDFYFDEAELHGAKIKFAKPDSVNSVPFPLMTPPTEPAHLHAA